MTPSATLRKFYTTLERNDVGASRRLLHPDFRFRGPMLQTDGAEQFLAAIKEMAMQSRFKDIDMIERGETIATFFTCEILQPFTGSFRMAERAVIREGRLVSSELIYDTGPFPK